MPNSASSSAIQTVARTVLSIAPSVQDIAGAERILTESAQAAERGYFTPQEDENLRILFGKYLLARQALHEAIAELKPIAFSDSIPSPIREQAFLVGYAAGTLLVNSATFIVQHARGSRLLRRKLDEAEPRFGIERKNFTKIYRSLTSPRHLYAMYQARAFSRQHAEQLQQSATTPELQEITELLKQHPIQFSGLKRGALSRLGYRLYSLLRRNISGYRQALFAVFEGSGRVVAEINNPFREKSVTPAVLQQLRAHMQPGDVLVTRHYQAMSNLFLPGFWPHVAYYIGTEQQRRNLNLNCSPQVWHRSSGEIEILEAKKDGVLFRPISETLQVDYVIIIRPQLSTEQIATSIERAVTHESKLYDFTFDFTRADRLVCSEVVYRAYDGVGNINLPLTERAGRMTLSAEDLLQKAIQADGFEVVGVFGIADAATQPVYGEPARKLIEASMNQSHS